MKMNEHQQYQPAQIDAGALIALVAKVIAIVALAIAGHAHFRIGELTPEDVIVQSVQGIDEAISERVQE